MSWSERSSWRDALDTNAGAPLVFGPLPTAPRSVIFRDGAWGAAMSFALNSDCEREMDDIFSRYPNKQAACIPLLHLCQEQNGWVNDDIICFVADRCELSTAHVQGVATFYSLFNREPVGTNEIWVCRTLSCALRGAGEVLHRCEQRLGIREGETTNDGKVTLRTAECLAACGQAPMMMVNKTYHENLTLDQVDSVLNDLVGKSG